MRRKILFYSLLSIVLIGPVAWWYHLVHRQLAVTPRTFTAPRAMVSTLPVQQTMTVPIYQIEIDDPHFPRHWRKGQINGVDYYIVPLSG